MTRSSVLALLVSLAGASSACCRRCPPARACVVPAARRSVVTPPTPQEPARAVASAEVRAAIDDLLKAGRGGDVTLDQATTRLRALGAPARIELERLLGDEDPYVAAMSAEAIGEFGAEAAGAAPALERLLRWPGGAPWAAAYALAEMGPVGARALARASGSDTENVRRAALLALGSIEEVPADVTPQLRAALARPDADTRTSALEVLSKIEDPAAFSRSATPFLSDPDRDVRHAAAVLVGHPGPDGEAKRALERLLEDEDELVREAAAEALQRIQAR